MQYKFITQKINLDFSHLPSEQHVAVNDFDKAYLESAFTKGFRVVTENIAIETFENYLLITIMLIKE